MNTSHAHDIVRWLGAALAAALLAGCASAPDPIAKYDLNHDGVLSDAEYQRAMREESLRNATQQRTSMRNSDVKGAADTALGAAAVGLGAANTVRAFVH